MIDNSEFAKKMRITILNMIHNAHASHIASAFSVVDILAVLYNEILADNDFDSKNMDRNQVVLSKGHAGSAVYSALFQRGLVSKADIENYYLNGSNLSGHVSHKGVNGVEVSTGSLGHGVCVASGMALAKKMSNNNGKVFAIVGDGECQEGSVWEMAMLSSAKKLNNLVVVVDKNNMQAMGKCMDVTNCDNLAEKWKVFGWNVIEVDGHNYEQIKDALIYNSDKPLCIIANTIKGRGVSFMENELLWHYRDPQEEFYTRAMEELNK